MSEKCTQDCSSCGAACSERKGAAADLHEKPNEASHIRRTVGIVSGKGGVGKSMVTSLLAVLMSRRGYRTAVLDADITGPSIPTVFGLKGKAQASEQGLYPVKSGTGISVMSLNLLLQNETDPVVWRGPILANTVRQFWTDVIWGDVDYLFIDMPPGTGDVPLTVFQSIPMDGIIVVTSPQELVGMIVAKAAKMAQLMSIPILGIVENMSVVKCPDCGREIRIFGESHVEETAEKYGIGTVARLPLDPELARACDGGRIEEFRGDFLDGMADMLERLPE